MNETFERYLELMMILADPNANVSNIIIEDALDEMESIWQSLSDQERKQLEKLKNEIR